MAEWLAECEYVYLQLTARVRHHTAKLEWIKPRENKPVIEKTIKVVNLLGGPNTGFGAKLKEIRARNLPIITKPKTPTPPPTPTDVCSWIEHFKSLPKIYPVKPQKVKPKMTTVMIAEYEERKRKRDMAMRYSTRQRIKKANYHLTSLKDLFLDLSPPPVTCSRNRPPTVY